MDKIRLRRSHEKEGFRRPVFEYRPDWPYISVGFGDERDYYVENLSLLIASGMGISTALHALSGSVKSWKMKKLTAAVESMVLDGLPLWRAFEAARLFPERILALVRSGEETGKLPEHLNLVTIQQHKEKVFRSRIRSALLYPSVVLALAFVVALGSTWIVLPNLVSVFSEARGTLPLNTRILLWLGNFLEQWGMIAVPGIIAVLSAAVYLLFFQRRTKFLGDAVLFSLPGIKNLVQGVELARFGYTTGALLQAGFQIDESIQSMKEGTSYRAYRKFYDHLTHCVLQGDSLRSAMTKYPQADRYIPSPIQQLIFSAEQSGRLPETLMKIGVIFEEKTDALTQDLATILEPVILVVVGLIVGFVVFGIIGPIYGLATQIN